MTVKQLLILIGVLVVIGVAAGGGWYFWQMQSATGAGNDTQQNTQVIPSEQPAAVTGGGMKAKTSTSETGPAVSPITTVVMSATATGSQATALAHTTTFAPTTQKIHVTALLPSTTKATRATLTVTYLKDGSALGPVSANVKINEGVTFASFEMSSPPKGWPVGEYKVLIGLSTGEAQEVPFSVQ